MCPSNESVPREDSTREHTETCVYFRVLTEALCGVGPHQEAMSVREAG